MPSGSIHVVKNWQDFLLSYDWIIFHRMYPYHIIYTHLSVGRTLGASFFILAIMNIGANEHRNTNISSRPWFHFLLDVCSEVKFTDHTVVLFLTFWGTSILLSIGAASVYNPNSAQRYPFLYIPANICHLLSFMMITILTGVWWYLIMVLICSFLMISDVVHLFLSIGHLCVV